VAIELTQDQSLELWRGALVAGVRSDAPDLTARQLAILLTVYTLPPPHTVRGLAAGLGISKPAVTRALDRLSELGLTRRMREPADRRSVVVSRTVKGAVFLSDLAATIARAGESLGADIV
jgi:DNA-binding MarR family transcriptional regulator